MEIFFSFRSLFSVSSLSLLSVRGWSSFIIISERMTSSYFWCTWGSIECLAAEEFGTLWLLLGVIKSRLNLALLADGSL